MTVVYNTHVTEIGEVRCQFYYESERHSVGTFLILAYLAHWYSMREDGRIARCHDPLSYLEFSMTRHILHVSIVAVAAQPSEVSEIARPIDFATDGRMY